MWECVETALGATLAGSQDLHFQQRYAQCRLKINVVFVVLAKHLTEQSWYYQLFPNLQMLAHFVAGCPLSRNAVNPTRNRHDKATNNKRKDLREKK